MRVVWAIAAKDLRQRFRDRSAIALGFVAPLLIATLISFAFQSSSTFSADVGVVDADHGPVAAAYLQMLEGPDLRSIVHVHRVASEAEARQQVAAGSLSAAVVLAPGLSRTVDGDGDGDEGDKSSRTVLLTSVDHPIAAQVLESITVAFTSRVNGTRLAVASAIGAGAPTARASELVEAAQRLDALEHPAERSIGGHPLSPISYYAPGMAIFFLFFAIGFGARSYFSEVQSGTLERLSAAPVHPGQILVGKALSILVYCTTSLAVMMLVTSLAFGARWGDPLAAAVLGGAVVLSVVSLTTLVTSVARTERQADGLSVVLVFGLALLGGNFVFVSSAPPLMRRLALLTPNGWALRGYIDLATGSGRLSTVVVPVLAVLAFSAVAFAVSLWRAPRLVPR